MRISTGWLTVLSAALILASGCATGPRKSPEQEQSDRELAQRVESALDSDRFLYARHISVRADAGVVRLGGYVWSESDLAEAQRIAEMVPGVTRVVDEIELERNSNDNNGVTR